MGEEPHPRQRVGPWVPAIPAKTGPLGTGGDTPSSLLDAWLRGLPQRRFAPDRAMGAARELRHGDDSLRGGLVSTHFSPRLEHLAAEPSGLLLRGVR
jgi:hypothetical protein